MYILVDKEKLTFPHVSLSKSINLLRILHLTVEEHKIQIKTTCANARNSAGKIIPQISSGTHDASVLTESK